MGKPRSGGAASSRAARTAAPGDNSKPQPPVASAALIAEAIRVYGQDREVIASATGKCGAHLAAYEAQGVDPEFVKSTWKEMGRTEAEAVKRHAQRTQYLVAAKVITPADADWSTGVSQSGLDLTPAAGDVADQLAEVRARALGIKAGKKGHSLESNPYKSKLGSPEFVGWRDGLQAGLELRKERKPGSENVVSISAAPGARRKPGAAAAPAADIAGEVAAELAAKDGAGRLH